MATMVERLLEQRNVTWGKAKALLDKAASESRELTVFEDKAYMSLTSDLEALATRAAQLVKDEKNAKDAEESLRSIFKTDVPLSNGGISKADQDLAAQFRNTIRSKSREPIEIFMPEAELRSGYSPGIERRALALTSSTMTGTTFYSQLQRHLVANSAILSAGATVLDTATGEPLTVGKTTALSAASLVAEGATIPDSDPTLGSVTFNAYKFAFLVRISNELAQDTAFDLVGYLAEQAGQVLANGFGAYAITGTGTAQPAGVLTGAGAGNTGPTGTATSFGTHTTIGQGGDLLVDLVGSLAEPYARSAAAGWLMRNETLTVIRKLRDSTGRYIFSTDVVPGSGSAGTLLNRPVYTDPNMPAIAASAKSILFGDLSRYWVRAVNGISFERSDDFAFDKDQAVFRCKARLDGKLIDTTGAVKYFQHSAT